MFPFPKKMIRRMPKIYFGKNPDALPAGSLVLFPVHHTLLCCGLAGIISFKTGKKSEERIHIDSLEQMVKKLEENGFSKCKPGFPIKDHYLGGPDLVACVLETVRALKQDLPLHEIFNHEATRTRLQHLAQCIRSVVDRESRVLSTQMGFLGTDVVDSLSARIDDLKDAVWTLSFEVLENVEKIKRIRPNGHGCQDPSSLRIYKKVNTVLNSIDRLEVRGRDSAGLSLMFVMDGEEHDKYLKALERSGLSQELAERLDGNILMNRSIRGREFADPNGKRCVSISFAYKIAAEIGSLGDNANFIRNQIRMDPLLQALTDCSFTHQSFCAHTRWASVGAISEPNCHPVDGCTEHGSAFPEAIIHVCLNGDIDNYQELKEGYASRWGRIPAEITTDTKIIPLQIQSHMRKGIPVEEAFRLAVNDFKGSHAISMHTDLAPGKIFLAQRGSGQAIFVGISQEHYLYSSEVYGFVEETSRYLKLNGEKIVEGKNGRTQGQIFILDQDSAGGRGGIRAMYYDGTPVGIEPGDIKHTGITSRDIDRQGYPHYFLKEISEAPLSVERTLLNRWKIVSNGSERYEVVLDETVFPLPLKAALAHDRIRRVFFVGQGTAGVAAKACADIFEHYVCDTAIQVHGLKASELSGFKLDRDARNMNDCLVVAISQSGTTTDTNRTVDMVKARGAFTLGIVNRRDSDLTFKVDGVMYTSSGRDIEMSVASTKAFYSQIVAGALMGLYIARLKGRRDDVFVGEEMKRLLQMPAHMRKVLSMKDAIEASARRLAPARTYWAVVGSGPNKASADEVRIKLSELCYKTISSDFVEDKKHIDLSSEPLIIVCAAGARDSVIGDIVKDTAIFKAHKATPVVIADEGETRFHPYAEDVFYVPAVSEHLAPILNTLVGHLWGYYAALSIHEGSAFLHGFRQDLQETVDRLSQKGLDIYEIVLEESFREKIAGFDAEFRKRKLQSRIPSIMTLEAISDLPLLLKYLSGRLPVSDFVTDFGKKGTALNMLSSLLVSLGESINRMARPVDAIKHQAKTVTVGTSRISEKTEGLLFEFLSSRDFKVSQLTPSNVQVLKNLQEVVDGVIGSTTYRIRNLSLLGEPTEKTTIEVVKKDGALEGMASRVEADRGLKGTKRIIVRQGNVYIGKGRKDDRSLIIIPALSAAGSPTPHLEHLLLLNIVFKEKIPLAAKVKALGGKFEHIKNIVQENSLEWKDEHLEIIAVDELFGRSAEKVAEYIISQLDISPEAHEILSESSALP